MDDGKPTPKDSDHAGQPARDRDDRLFQRPTRYSGSSGAPTGIRHTFQPRAFLRGVALPEIAGRRARRVETRGEPVPFVGTAGDRECFYSPRLAFTADDAPAQASS